MFTFYAISVYSLECLMRVLHLLFPSWTKRTIEKIFTRLKNAGKSDWMKNRETSFRNKNDTTTELKTEDRSLLYY
jgi:hypothetical protein